VLLCKETDVTKKEHRKLLTIPEVRERTQSSQSAVYNWIRDGKLVALKLGRSTRIPEESLDAFLNGLPIVSLKGQAD
jgi:excisionase family DNA binding protein